MKLALRYLSLILAVLLPLKVSAQSQTLLDKLNDAFASHCVEMDCTYSIQTGGIASKGECKVSIQGTSYVMRGNGLEIFCDGKSVWVLDSAAMEAVVEPVTDDSFSYMTNPALLFRDMDKLFAVSSASASASGTRYQLKAVTSCGIKNAVLHIASNAALRDAEFTLDDDGVIRINVLSQKSLPVKDTDSFLPSTLSEDWVVTDFR